MRIRIFFVFLVLTVAPRAQAQQKPDYKLPAGARVLEAQAVPAQAHANRLLILWMLKPSKHALPYGSDEYTCPDETRGSYYSGPTRVSLFDTKRRVLINTVEIKDEHMEDKDTFDLPYKIHRGAYYRVAGVSKGQEGKPTLMWLRDYNGDGRALEFAFFDAVACMGLETTLIGYSIRQDKVIQYPIHLTRVEQGERITSVEQWADYLFSAKPLKPGRWKYEIDYRGRGGTLDQYEFRYNRQEERFEGTLVSKSDEGK